MALVPRLHILTSDAIVSRPDFLAVATALLHAVGPRGALHLRTRLLAGGSYRTLAEHLVTVSRETGAMLVVNDRVDVALAAGADGVQLGHGALRPTDVAHVLARIPHHPRPGRFGWQVGVSVHDPEEAREAVGANWVMAGNVFATETHPDRPGRGIAFLEAVVAAAAVPVIAVGGITPAHMAPLLRAGAAGVAVISEIWNSQSPGSVAMHYL